MSERERRLVFGEVAELYDRARPGYPDALIDDLAGWAGEGEGPSRALEVGAGTGKATRRLSARGVEILAVEPDPAMAARLRETLRARPADAGAVRVLEGDFESAELGGRRFPLLFAAQAWHWVSVPDGYAAARAALQAGGRLVPFWNRPVWAENPLRDALDAVYAAHVPAELRGGPYTPWGASASDAGTGWAQLIEGIDGFADPDVREYPWSIDYTAREYAELVTTHSETRLLPDATRAAFLDGVEAAIRDAGGTFRLGMRTLACVARAV